MPAKPLQVVRVYTSLDVGGIETRLVDLLPRIDSRRFEHRVVLLRRRGKLAGEMEARGIPVDVSFCYGRTPKLIPTLRLARTFRRIRPHIVHAHTVVPALYATAAARLAGVPIVIANFHSVNTIPLLKQRWQEWFWSKYRDATIHVSEAVQENYDELIHPRRDTNRVLYNGVDLSRFGAPLPKEREQTLRRELGIEAAAPIVLTVARLHPHKRHGDLLDAFHLVKQDYPQAVLLLAGEGVGRSAIEERISQNGLRGGVRVLGDRSDAHELMQLADLHVLCSEREGFSNVVLETLAAGLPQILTDVGGNREAIGTSPAGVFVPVGDSAALAQMMLSVLHDERRRSAMRIAAMERAREFSVAQQVRNTEQLYSELAHAKGLA